MWVELRAAAASGLFLEPNGGLPKLPLELAQVSTGGLHRFLHAPPVTAIQPARSARVPLIEPQKKSKK